MELALAGVHMSLLLNFQCAALTGANSPLVLCWLMQASSLFGRSLIGVSGAVRGNTFHCWEAPIAKWSKAHSVSRTLPSIIQNNSVYRSYIHRRSKEQILRSAFNVWCTWLFLQVSDNIESKSIDKADCCEYWKRWRQNISPYTQCVFHHMSCIVECKLYK